MNILLSNDDGVRAEGIIRFAEVLRTLGDVYVFAPTEQMSCCGHGVSVKKTICARDVRFPGAVRAVAVDGTPADCMKVAFKMLAEDGVEVDMVFSGVNMGGNLGTDTLYSGTISAAMEAILIGIPAVAASVDSHEPRHYEAVLDLALRLGRLGPAGLRGDTVLSINAPDLPREEIKGVKVTRLGVREYDAWIREESREDGLRTYKYASSNPIYAKGIPEDTDVAAHRDGYATITPLGHDLTARGLVEETRKLIDGLHRTESG
ncbi:MAG: 5'/3'-nucleotidase SurE [Clostridiales Family XIII bacterium]|jgi:5'-nucleotidase|nr:5'/3'-nucleotidase SurE [Clostridiales Family XIII bacterium]